MMGKMFSSLGRAINRLFIRENWFWSLSAVIRICGTTLLYLYTEFKYSQMLNLACNIGRSSIHIHPNVFHSNYDNKFVYLKTNNILYGKLFNTDFNFSINAIKLFQNVEYCQWVEEGFDSTDKKTRTRRYLKSWVKYPINSTNFMDQRYYNPSTLSFSDMKMESDVGVGVYHIKSNLFNETSELKYYDPGKIHYKGFDYIGNGYFYKSFSDISNHKNYKTNQQKFKQCTPGDVRVRITYFAPEKISVVGYLEGHNITSKNIRGIEMGSARSGYFKPAVVLSQAHRHKRKYALVSRCVAVIASIVLIIHRSTSMKARTWNYFMFGLLVLFVRSFMWNTRYLNPYFWFSVLSIISCIYSTRPEQFVTFD